MTLILSIGLDAAAAAKDDAERVGVLDLAGNSLCTGLSLVNGVSGRTTNGDKD